MTISFEQAMCEPARFFKQPLEVLEQDDWSNAERTLLLRQWAYVLRQQRPDGDSTAQSAQQSEQLLAEIDRLLEQLGNSPLFGSHPSSSSVSGPR